MAADEAKPSLAEVIRKLNGTAEAALEVQLPQGGEHYYYSNFPAYSEPLKDGLATVQQLMATCESMIRTRRAPPPDWADADDVATWSSELLDDVLEKLDGALDAEQARARGREPRRLEAAAAAPAVAAGAPDDNVALMANLPSFGGTAVRPSRPKDMVRHAAGLARPQQLFDPPPDNRREVPFRPRVDHLAGLTAEPCDPRVYLATLGASEEYPHPFAADLGALIYRPDQLQAPAAQSKPPPDPEVSPLVWVDGAAALEAMVSELSTAEELAIDLEHHSHRSFQGFTCLMQISTRSTDFVVDTLALRNQLGPALARVFADPRVVKVLHGADFDVEWLQRDFGLFLVNMFDTGQAARVLGLPSFGLAHLMESICRVVPDKRFQMADWRVRPLSEAMMHYARCDTHYLLYVYDKLREQLAALPSSRIPPSLAVPLPASNPGGALGLVLERSRQLCLKAYRKPAFTPTGYQDMLLKWNLILSPQQTAVFAALLEWRDRVCRAEDEGTGYVLSKAQLVALAQAMPEDAKRVQSVLGRAMSEVATRRLGELLGVIQEARHRPLQPPAPAAAATTASRPAALAAAAAAGAAAGAAAAAAATAPSAAAPPRAALPVLKPRVVAPIRTAAAKTAVAAAAAAATAASGGRAAPVAPVSVAAAAAVRSDVAPGETAAASPSEDVAASAEVEAGGPSGRGCDGDGTAAAAPAPATAAPATATCTGPGGGGAIAGGGGGDMDVSATAGTAKTGGNSGGEAAQGRGAGAAEVHAAGSEAAAPPAAVAGGALKPRALKPPPVKSAMSRSAALFGGGGAASAPGPPATAAAGADPAPSSGTAPAPETANAAGSIARAAAGVAEPSGKKLASWPPAPGAVRLTQRGSTCTSLLGALFGGGGGSGSGAAPSAATTAAYPAAAATVVTDDEERLAQHRAKRLRTTFALPFMTAPAAASAEVRQSSAGANVDVDADADAGVASTSGGDGVQQGRVKPSATAADIRAAVEAMQAQGDDVEIVLGADGRQEAPSAQGTSDADPASGDGGGGGDGGQAAAAAAANGRNAPGVRSLALTDSGSDDSGADDEADGAGDAGAGGMADGGAAGAGQRRVAGSELGLDALDYVPVPLSQMNRKDKWGKGKKRGARAEQPSDGVEDGGGGGGASAVHKKRRFTTEVPAVATAAAAAEQYDNDDESSGSDGSDSDGGHTVGPFAKKRRQKQNAAMKKQQRQQQQQQEQQQQQKQAQGRRGRGRGRPEPKGLMADFPRTNLALPDAEAKDAGRGGDRGRGGRGRVGAGAGRGRGGRQPTAFNPYDIPEEFLMKGGKRSAVMPRSGNRSFTFK